MEKQILTTEDIEKRVFASLVYTNTSKQAKAVAEKEKLEPEMFESDRLREMFFTWLQLGGEPFDAYIDNTPVSSLATAQEKVLKTYVKHIIRVYRKRVRMTDRTLDEFSTPGNDADDEDCLFKNRWMRRGACGFIISTSGVGKSTFTMQAATQWAVGETLLGITPIKPIKVGIIQSEDDDYDVALYRDRIRIGLRKELGWSEDKIAEAESRVTFCAWDGSTGKDFVKYLRHKQEVHHFDLVIVNPLHAFIGGDLNKADIVSAFLRNGIDRVIKDEDTKCAIIFVHHTGKPSKEKLAEGDFFAAYLGSGSTELTNYTRVALTIVPYREGKHHGFFELIGSKHGDKLGWKTPDNRFTTKKVVCYANRLERHNGDGAIFWCEPTADEVMELCPDPKAMKGQKSHSVPQMSIEERCAKVLVNYIKEKWTPTLKPANAENGQRDWCQRLTGLDHGFTRALRGKVYDDLLAAPEAHGLQVFAPTEKNRRPYLIGKVTAATTTETDLGF